MSEHVLKECPFCGNEHPSNEVGRKTTRCQTCMAEGPMLTGNRTKDWNTRTPADNGEVANGCPSCGQDCQQCGARQYTEADIGEVVRALECAKLQIIYLHEKFKETGSGNQVLTQIESALEKVKGVAS